jgi:hypothetical protein
MPEFNPYEAMEAAAQVAKGGVPAGAAPGAIAGTAAAAGAGAAEGLGAGLAEAAVNIEQPLLDAVQWYEIWMGKVPPAERLGVLREIMVEQGVSEGWLAKFDAEGHKVLRGGRSSVMGKLGKGMTAAQRGAFETHWDLARRYPKGIPARAHDNFAKQVIGKLRKVPGVPPEFVDDIGKLPVSMLRKVGPASALSTLESVRQPSAAGKIWRWAFQGTEAGKPPPHLTNETRNVLAQLQGEAPAAEPPTGATTRMGRAKQFAKRAQMRVAPKGALPPPDKEALAGLRKAGVKGAGRGARALKGMGGLGPMLGAGFVGLEVLDAAVGGQVRAREMYEAWASGQGMANPSESLLRDFLSKRDNVVRRRAMLARDPELMQRVVQAIAGSTPQSPYTPSEVPGGAAAPGPVGNQLKQEEMDAILEEFLSQLGES